MARDFGKALAWIKKAEGTVFTDNPLDPGGATHTGITQRAYDDWTQETGRPGGSVRDITEKEIEDFYLREWNYAHVQAAYDVDDNLGLAAFDFTVNSGPDVAVQLMQRTVNALVAMPEYRWANYREPLVVDAVFGPKTANALEKVYVTALGELVTEYLFQRLEGYRRLAKHWYRQGKIQQAALWLPVWLARVIRLRQEMMS